MKTNELIEFDSMIKAHMKIPLDGGGFDCEYVGGRIRF